MATVTKNKTASDFALENQFGSLISVEFPSDKPVVLVFADRESSNDVEAWVMPIYDKFSDKIKIYGIAELSGVPGFVRPLVRGMIRSEYPVLFDWTGEVSEEYGFEKNKVNIFVIGKKGKITAAKRGTATIKELEFLLKKITALLKE